jgi:DNA helicase-2/ATP-dependent DNA helicase PcrA
MNPPAHANPDSPLLEGLTPAQREAVLTTEGPLLVLAGPGSGKTRVITRRIAHLMALGVRPWRILAVTFTNKAAGEMRHRVSTLLGEDAAAKGLTVTTFHSLCVRLLRRYGELSAAEGVPVVKPNFSIYDADDQAAVVKRVLADQQLSTTNFPPRSVLSVISAAKNDLMDAQAYAAQAGDFYTRTIAKAYAGYTKALEAAGAVDFDDLLLLTARMLRSAARVRAEVQARFRYLLVDEYQDTNRAQLVIATLIAGEDAGPKGGAARPAGPNICVVGDPDQSIYGWRGADIANILEFEQHFPSARTIALGDNFRSLPPIIHAADRLIRHNLRRKHKPLTAVRAPERGTAAPAVEIVRCRDEHHEAALVIDWFKARREGARGVEWKDCAVFYRNNALSRVIEDGFRAAGIPYVLVRGTSFYQREEVRNALAYLRVVANLADSVSLERIVNTPARGLSDATWDKLVSAAMARGCSVPEIMARAGEVGGLTARAQQAAMKFADQLDSWAGRVTAPPGGLLASQGESDDAAPVGALAELVERVIRESGLEDYYRKEDERRENLAELVSSAREFEDEYRRVTPARAPEALTPPTSQTPEPPPDPPPDDAFDPFAPGAFEAFPGNQAPAGDDPAPPVDEPAPLMGLLRAYLERVALVADTDAIDPAHGAVTLMTLHAAKGLEYKAVAVIGLEEGLLPHSRSQENEAQLEEERRLCFVGVTRAMDRLILTSAAYRTLRGVSERQIPSRFIDELRGEGVTVQSLDDPLGFDDEHERDSGMRDYLGGGVAAGFGTARSIPAGRVGSTAESDAGAWSIGMKVRHPQFGIGKIEAVSGGADARVRVKFGVGVKTLVLQYARLEPCP